MSAPQSAEKTRTTVPFSESPASLEMKRPKNDSKHAGPEHAFEWAELIRIAFVAFAAAAVWYRVWEPFPHISVVGIAAALIGGYPIFKEAFENIVERKMTMELSMTIALLSALAIGEFFTALVITGFNTRRRGSGKGLTVGPRAARHPGPSRFPAQNGFSPTGTTKRLKYLRKTFDSENGNREARRDAYPLMALCKADALLWNRQRLQGRRCRLRKWREMWSMPEP